MLVFKHWHSDAKLNCAEPGRKEIISCWGLADNSRNWNLLDIANFLFEEALQLHYQRAQNTVFTKNTFFPLSYLKHRQVSPQKLKSPQHSYYYPGKAASKDCYCRGELKWDIPLFYLNVCFKERCYHILYIYNCFLLFCIGNCAPKRPPHCLHFQRLCVLLLDWGSRAGSKLYQAITGPVPGSGYQRGNEWYDSKYSPWAESSNANALKILPTNPVEIVFWNQDSFLPVCCLALFLALFCQLCC